MQRILVVGSGATLFVDEGCAKTMGVPLVRHYGTANKLLTNGRG